MTDLWATPRISLAPMEGVLDPILRDIICKVGGIDRATTEFVRVTNRLLPDHVFYLQAPELKHGGRTSSGVPVFVQLLGGQSSPMAENAARLAEIGALGLDLNFGCPAKTVNRHDGGASLLREPHRIENITAAVRRALPKTTPLTVKVRLGFADKNYVTEIAQAAEAGGAAYLTVHARTKIEMYTPPAHWSYIALMKSAVKIPIIANGEIWTANDHSQCMAESQVTHVALGRGLVAQPDLARQILFSEPSWSWSQILPLVEKFFIETEKMASRRALPRLKQWLKYLSRTYPEAQLLFDRIKILTENPNPEIFHASIRHS